jgi:hypothetical protein
LPKEVVGIATIIEFDDNYRFFTTSCEWSDMSVTLSGTFFYIIHLKKDTKDNFEKNVWSKNKSRQNAQGLAIFFLQLILLNDCWRNLAGIVWLVWLIHGHIISDQGDINRIWAGDQQRLSGLCSPLKLDLCIPVFFGYTYLRILSYSCRLVRYNLRKSASFHHNVNFPPFSSFFSSFFSPLTHGIVLCGCTHSSPPPGSSVYAVYLSRPIYVLVCFGITPYLSVFYLDVWTTEPSLFAGLYPPPPTPSFILRTASEEAAEDALKPPV